MPRLVAVRVRARHHPDVLPLRARVFTNINLDIKMAVLHLPPDQGNVQFPGFSLLNKGLVSVYIKEIRDES